MLIVLLGAWLGILGPAFDEGELLDKLEDWQTLAAALVAVFAAIGAYINTTRTLRLSEKQERHRRERKRAAIRAGLPLALAEISEYGHACATPLRELYKAANEDLLDWKSEKGPDFPNIPSNAVKTITDFIEYSEEFQTGLFENFLALLQIQSRRIQGMVETLEGREPHFGTAVPKLNIREYIIDTATIYAAANAGYSFGRRLASEMPETVTWADVRSALFSLGFHMEEFPDIWESINARGANGGSAFTYLTARK